MSERVEIAVIGAGIAGLSAALRLAEAGRIVLVLDQGQPFRGGSGMNAGTLALQNKTADLILFYRDALAEWRRLAGELADDSGYVRKGGLRVAETADEVAALRGESAEQRRLGIETEWLEGNALGARAPWLGPTIAAATFCAGDGFASPLLVGRALVKAVERAGGRTRFGTRLVAQTPLAAGYRLETTGGAVEAETVVLAAGPWSAKVAALFDVGLPLVWHVNMLTVTERVASFTDNLVVTHIAGRYTFKQFPNGSCLLGGGWRGSGDIETGRRELNYRELLDNLALHTRIIPPLASLAALRSWAGFEAETPDHWSVCGALPGRSRLFAAVPAMAGFTAGPLIGRLAAECVLAGKLSAFARRLDPARFAA